jgi:hypothetical protein
MMHGKQLQEFNIVGFENYRTALILKRKYGNLKKEQS